jgi:hypothetical protein
MKKTKTISGHLVDALLKGAKIIATGHDRYDEYVLVENPKGSEWKYQQFQTVREFNDDANYFNLMVSYNDTPKATFKKFQDDYIKQRIHIEKYRPDLLAK